MCIDWIRFCRESMKAAGEEIMTLYTSDQREEELSRGYGGDMTLVADQRSEDIFIENLHQAQVNVRLISEERGETHIGKTPQYILLLDPLDGSFNFKHGLPYFGISLAVLDRNARPIAGYILDLSQDAEFWATQDGAYRNGKRMQATGRVKPDRLLIECSGTAEPEDVGMISRAISKMKHVRAPGAVALDLCRIAEGSFDCLLCAGISRYLDVAAGIYILEKAGGNITDFKGNPDIREGTDLTAKSLFAAGNPSARACLMSSGF